MRPAEEQIRVGELFAGVGGFRIALEGYSDDQCPDLSMERAGDFQVVWANQWEPPGKASRQFAWKCYEARFGKNTCKNTDINIILEKMKDEQYEIPDFDLLVAGFPCQDYSAAKPLGLAKGIEGEKGRLWWVLHEILGLKKPKYVLLENVDKLLRGKAANNGCDFAMMLASLNQLNYSVEWRIINAADYGFPQKRRRVYIFAQLDAPPWDLRNTILETGVIASAFPVKINSTNETELDVSGKPLDAANNLRSRTKTSPFQNAGAMQNGVALTMKVEPSYTGNFAVLENVLVDEHEVPEEFFIPNDKQSIWESYKSSKRERRRSASGHEYIYAEGAMPWPDPINKPSRTILTSEGGSGASRMKHAIKTPSGRFRRLTPDELDMLQGFPKGWTDTGMTNAQRAFCMGNALVVQIPHAIGKEIARRNGEEI